MRYDLNQDNPRRRRRIRISRFVLWRNFAYSSMEFIARESLLPPFDARDVTAPEHSRVTRCIQKIAVKLRFSCYVENVHRLRIKTKPKLCKARVILRDISRLMSEKNFEWKYLRANAHASITRGRIRSGLITDTPYDLRILLLLFGERNLAHQRASGLT